MQHLVPSVELGQVDDIVTVHRNDRGLYTLVLTVHDPTIGSTLHLDEVRVAYLVWCVVRASYGACLACVSSRRRVWALAIGEHCHVWASIVMTIEHGHRRALSCAYRTGMGVGGACVPHTCLTRASHVPHPCLIHVSCVCHV